MSATIFQSELSGLIQESKRKHPLIKAAAEKSLSELKALPVTSEAQLAGDLLRKPSFVEPFVLACRSRNIKLVTGGVICLQRLTASHALPPERLNDVLDAFRELTSSGFDVQIKILQTLPSLVQTYAADIYGALLFITLDICGALQASKTPVVSSTASATFQQLVSSTFERVEDDDDDAPDSEVSREVQIGERTLGLSKAAVDSFDIFADLCAIADGVSPKRFKSSTLSPTFVLDLIVTVLDSNQNIFHTHSELLFICWTKLMPTIVRQLSARHPFPVTIRLLRALYLLISRHLAHLQNESETALGLLIHFLDPEAAQGWKRAACLEFLRNLVVDFPLLHKVFRSFDMKEGRKDIVSNMMAAFARIAAEKPSLIGLSHQSTMPARQTDGREDAPEQASLEAAGVEGIIGSTVTAEPHIIGISNAWSLPKISCLEQLDKSEAPDLPETYVYSLVLDCMSAFSEGLAKVVMPTSVARNEKKRTQTQATEQPQGLNEVIEDAEGKKTDVANSAIVPHRDSRPTIPQRSIFHAQSESIRTSVALVTSCWPAFLATCATFLNAALDTDLYHNLVRAIQKIAQVAGVLELSTPRDALLTTLAKAAVPPQVPQIGTTADTRKGERQSAVQNADEAGSTITSPVGMYVAENRTSTKADISLLTTRNLLCVRALLNLGIALGPTLSQEAWFIVLETLQEAEELIKLSSQLLMNQNAKLAEGISGNEPGTSRASLSGEIAAVQTASKKMFASSANYENNIFLGLLKALFGLSASTESTPARRDIVTPSGTSTSRRIGRMHPSARNLSGHSFNAAAEASGIGFVLSKTSELARSNLGRFVSESASDSGWALITASLLQAIMSDGCVSEVRLRAASLLDTIILGTVQILDEEDENLQRQVQHRVVSVLEKQIETLYHHGASSKSDSCNVDFDIHQRALETLSSIIEQHGQNLFISWHMIFELAGTIFEARAPSLESTTPPDVRAGDVRTRNAKLISTAFRLLQLIGSDFLGLVPLQQLLDFIDLLLLFGCQQDDLNISLTSTTFFWNLADFLHSSQGHPSLSDFADLPTEDFLVGEINGSKDPAHVVNSLWLVLLLRLNTLTVDPRPEVRNGAIRVILRILDASGPSLTPRGWHICLSTILMRLLTFHASLLSRMHQQHSELGPKNLDECYASTVALLEGAVNLLCHYIQTIAADECFPVFWGQFLDLLGSILPKSSLAVSSAAFHGVTSLFSALKKANHHDGQAAGPALRLWIQCHPADIVNSFDGEDDSTNNHASNQEALTAHGETFLQISQTLSSVTLDQIGTKDIMQTLRKTILRCVHSRYGSDILKMAPEQQHVIAILLLLSETRTSMCTEYYNTLFDFIQIAFKEEADLKNHPEPDMSTAQGPISRNGRRPSFVAFAARCIDLLEADIIRIFQHGSLTNMSLTIKSALEVLSEAIKAKYSAKGQRGDPFLWQKATSSALAIVETIGSLDCKKGGQEDVFSLYEIYDSATEVAAGILGSGSLRNMVRPQDDVALVADEEHDIAAFRRLSVTLIAALTTAEDSNLTTRQQQILQIRRKFVIKVFHASMISVPQYADLPTDQDLSSSPLSSLSQIRPGTIKEIVYHARSNIPYLALDTMFRLIAAVDGGGTQEVPESAGHTALARIAAPYVLLRAAHTFKSFIADQPLRGPMPMPPKLRTEMLYILRSCLALRSEDEAFIGTQDSTAPLGQDGRRHLRALYPLIVRVMKVWRRVPRYGFSWITDQDGVEIEKCLYRWIEICGQNWELASFDS
jgi:Dimerisation and cyclophilin-binding domain of Mon2/Guanine nucleotide exchange factor in Golgi transport N-terminal/C-terminal region of Mon2 protein